MQNLWIFPQWRRVFFFHMCKYFSPLQLNFLKDIFAIFFSTWKFHFVHISILSPLIGPFIHSFNGHIHLIYDRWQMGWKQRHWELTVLLVASLQKVNIHFGPEEIIRWSGFSLILFKFGLISLRDHESLVLWNLGQRKEDILEGDHLGSLVSWYINF